MSVKKLSIVPIDVFDNLLVDHLRSKLESALSIQTSLLTWESITDTYRSQFKVGLKYYSTELLNFFSEKLPDDIEKILFITSDDLYSPVFARYFGEAQLSGRIGIVSSFFLKDALNDESSARVVFLSRFEKVMIHEVGHLFGLKHCGDINCVMKLSGKPDDIDIKSPGFCAACTEVLINATLID